MQGLAGKVAIVTGASRGIGAAAALALGEAGASVMLAARSMRAGRGERAADQRGRRQGVRRSLRRVGLRRVPAACARNHAALRAARCAGEQRRRHRADQHGR